MSFNSNSNRSENESLPQQNPIQISAFGLDAMMQRMLITLGLAIIGAFSNEFTYWTNFIANIAGHALGIWICGCSLFYKRELWVSKSAGAHSTKSLKISGCKR